MVYWPKQSWVVLGVRIYNVLIRSIVLVRTPNTQDTQLATEEGIQYKLWKGFSITFKEGVSRIEPYREAVVSIFCACFSYTGIWEVNFIKYQRLLMKKNRNILCENLTHYYYIYIFVYIYIYFFFFYHEVMTMKLCQELEIKNDENLKP